MIGEACVHEQGVNKAMRPSSKSNQAPLANGKWPIIHIQIKTQWPQILLRNRVQHIGSIYIPGEPSAFKSSKTEQVKYLHPGTTTQVRRNDCKNKQ